MKLSRPKEITWIVAVILGIVGLVLHFAIAPGNNIIPLVVALAGLLLLAMGNALKGL
jgi:uncharacterized membrane protein